MDSHAEGALEAVQEALQEETRILELINENGIRLAGNLDLPSLLLAITDAATAVSGARFGWFRYRPPGDAAEAIPMHTLSGIGREEFDRLAQAHAHELPGAALEANGPVRCDDVLAPEWLGAAFPEAGLLGPELPVRSYLMVPVVSRSGEALGGLFLFHPDVGKFTPRRERLVASVAAQASVAIDNARLFQSLQGASEAQARLAAIVESSDDAIVSKTLQGIITSWNDAARRLYGFTAEEMVGQSILKLIPPELHDEEGRILANIRAGRRIEHFETVRMTRTGRRVEVSITVSPVRDASGTIIGASKICRDITPQRDAQRKKDEFLAILAHELRNPLAPVRNAISLFKQENVSVENRQRAQRIAERQIAHMARLLDDLLDVSRINSGRVELKREMVELRPIVLHAVEAARAVPEAKNHTLTLDLTDEEVWLEADGARILQIVTNLVTNAAKYTDPGGALSVAMTVEGDEAVISVADNGIGFAPEMKSQLFTLFSQAENAINRSAGGLGIGLALVREFVERHGGTVHANSAGHGQGSEFVVRLPRKRGYQRTSAA